MSEKKIFNLNKEKRYPKEGELHDRMLALIYEYDGEMATATAIGLLDLVKNSIINGES